MERGTKRDVASVKTIDYPISIQRVKDVTEYLDTKNVHKDWEVMFEDAKHTKRFTDIQWSILRIIVILYHRTNGLMTAGKIHEIIKKAYMEAPLNKNGANIKSKTGGGVDSVLDKYKMAIDIYYLTGKKRFKGDKGMVEMFEKDKADHYYVIDRMKAGDWKSAYKSWASMDTASREEITPEAYKLLNEKNGYAKQGATIKGFEYTIGGL